MIFFHFAVPLISSEGNLPIALRKEKTMPERKPEQEKEVMDWIEAVMEEPLPQGSYEEVRSWNVL